MARRRKGSERSLKERFGNRSDVDKKTFERLGITVTMYQNGVTRSSNFGEIIGYRVVDKVLKRRKDCYTYAEVLYCFSKSTENSGDDGTLFLGLEREFSQWLMTHTN